MKNGLLIAGAVILLLLLAAGLALIVRRLINRSAEKRVAAYQNELMERHYHEVENMYRQMRGWRHDISRWGRRIGWRNTSPPSTRI